MLVDRLRIDFKAGKGGNGKVSFAKFGRSLGKNGNLYYPQKGKPDGGDGGKGGDIYLEGSNDVYDLSDFTGKKEYIAQNGEEGLPATKQGKSGKDLILKVPVVTVVSWIDGKKDIWIMQDKERKCIARGGKGGIGNFAFREGQVRTLRKHTNGEDGEIVKAYIELRLAADIVFIGFPNAGKSSMLNALTRAQVKVASYPFTTLHPQLGMMDGIKLMDLPGLIEGVSKGKGLGKSFNKHADMAKVVAHLISLDASDIVHDYLVIRNELADFASDLSKKKEIVILTKADKHSPEEIKEKVAKIRALTTKVYVTSMQDRQTIEDIKEVFKKSLS